ncbi:MAG: heavy metal translocating P-type ATPase [Gemmatimonadales bacterium]|nr:heavy metal translocating P-type ATPase [Gemmatimonadales bacterium]MBP6569902.1 heavy metal translocating P-type ATPase [Gemmatimonadales bacterium]MBP7619986.1 heavy metal translocating P-type ATPase [Gemmatimonadales bacterium]
MTTTQLGTPCTHCGLAVPPALLTSDGAASFCCSGCETAYGIVQQSGLGQYYAFRERRETAVQSSGHSFEEFDHPAFAELYVQATADGRAITELYLEGVHCASCVWLVERVPLLLPGVVRAELDVRRALARIEWDPQQLPLSQVARTLDQLGYTPHPFRGVARDAMRRREDRAMLTRIGVAGAIAGNVMLPALALYSGEFAGMEAAYEGLFRWVSLGLTIPAMLFPGRVFFTGALAALRTRRLHMDLPIALALGAGFVRGAINTVADSGPIYFDGVTILIFALLTGRFLQQRGQRAAADAAELLYSLSPDSARVVTEDGSERTMPAAALLPGMSVRVRAGESFPADGTIIDGTTSVNAALLTGESRPVTAATGDVVHAGTLNVAAPVTVRIEEAGATSRLARLLRQVEESSARRAPVVAMADRMAGIFVAVVLALAVVTFALWVGRDDVAAWDNAIALLIVTCPCALALATPLAVTVAVGRAARAGIYIKGGDALEQLSRPGHLVLDKTGTVTEGRTALVAWHGDPSVQAMVLALEAGSSHPLADGFRRAWPDLQPPSAESVTHVIGGGIRGVVDGRDVLVGSPRFVMTEAEGGDLLLATLRGRALTPVLVAVDGVVVAAAGLGDRVRDGAAEALGALRRRGWRTTLLSGDDPAVAAEVGAALGFAADEAIGGATPEEKLARITAWRAEGGTVVMVGDGVNDAAAIAAAHVGIGVHGGAEACLATADVYLTSPGLAPLVGLMTGAERTIHVIRRNMVWALMYNLAGVVLAMSGTISPLIAAIMMPASSLTVVLGSWLGRTFAPMAGAAPSGAVPTAPRAVEAAA